MEGEAFLTKAELMRRADASGLASKPGAIYGVRPPSHTASIAKEACVSTVKRVECGSTSPLRSLLCDLPEVPEVPC